MNTNKTELIKISVYLQGIKKRARKSDRHFLDVVKDIPYTPDLNLNDYESAARKVIADNIKTVTSSNFAIRSSVYSVENDSGFNIMSANLFDERNKEILVASC